MKPRRKPRLKVPRTVIEAIPVVIDLLLDAYTRTRLHLDRRGRPIKPKSKSTPPSPDVPPTGNIPAPLEDSYE